MNKGTKIKKFRKVGFLIRMSKKSGRKIINSRRYKKRKKITN